MDLTIGYYFFNILGAVLAGLAVEIYLLEYVQHKWPIILFVKDIKQAFLMDSYEENTRFTEQRYVNGLRNKQYIASQS